MIDTTSIIPLNIQKEDIVNGVCQGMHYDADSMIWYVEKHRLTEALSRYAYDMKDFNIIAPYYLVLSSTMTCWNCHQPTRILAVMFTRYLRKAQDGKGWEAVKRNTFVFHINHLPDAIKKNIKVSHYYLDKSKTTGLRYWMNHCEFCGERLGDYELFCVAEDAFRLMTVEKLLHSNARKVNKLFVCTAGNPAEKKSNEVVRCVCDVRFTMNPL
ncbi:TPA: DNA primase [Citrobacter freundii]